MTGDMVENRNAEGLVRIVEQHILFGYEPGIVFRERPHVVACYSHSLLQNFLPEQRHSVQIPHREAVAAVAEVEVERCEPLLQRREVEAAVQVVKPHALYIHAGIEKMVGAVLHERTVGLPACRMVQIVEQHAASGIHGPAGGELPRGGILGTAHRSGIERERVQPLPLATAGIAQPDHPRRPYSRLRCHAAYRLQ